MAQNPPSPEPLATELAHYRRILPSLLDRSGEYAVIAGEDLLGTFSTWEDACKVGYAKVGVAKPFLVKRIEEVETVNYFTRNMVHACPT